MIFRDYLEIMTRQEMRRAANAGQTNLEKVGEVLSRSDSGLLPRWFLILLEEQLNMENIRYKSDFIEVMNETIFDNKIKPYPQNAPESIRFIITKNGECFWCVADDAIHGSILAYMMCKGKLQMFEELLDYGSWSETIASTDYFIAFIWDADDSETKLAESYAYELEEMVMRKLFVPPYKDYLLNITGSLEISPS